MNFLMNYLLILMHSEYSFSYQRIVSKNDMFTFIFRILQHWIVLNGLHNAEIFQPGTSELFYFVLCSPFLFPPIVLLFRLNILRSNVLLATGHLNCHQRSKGIERIDTVQCC